MTTDSIDWPDSSSSKCWRHSSSLAADCQRWDAQCFSVMIKTMMMMMCHWDDHLQEEQSYPGERTPRASRVTSKGKRDRWTDGLVNCDRLPLVNEQWNFEQSRSMVLFIDPRASSIKASRARERLLLLFTCPNTCSPLKMSSHESFYLFVFQRRQQHD